MQKGSDEKQKILFICPQPFFEWRGSSIRVKSNLVALSDQGFEIDLLTLPIGAEQQIDNVRVIRAWNIFASKKISIGPSILKLWFDLILLTQGLILILKNKYDVLHGTEEAGFICYLLSRLNRGKFIFEKHSDSNSYQVKGLLKPLLKIYRSVEKLTIRKSDAVICTGPGLTEQATSDVSDIQIAEKKIYTIPDTPSSIHEASAEKIQTVRQQFIQSQDDTIISYAGSFASYQGVDIIFEAIPAVLESNENAQFVIIGGSKEEINFYQTQLKEKGVSEKVHFLGKIHPDELSAYLSASDILLAPRKSGINSPLKILDYFKAGAAIVATNTLANQRLLNNDNSILCDFTASAFASAINTLIESPKERKRLSSNTYQLYKTKYNFNEFKQQLNEVYQTLLP